MVDYKSKVITVEEALAKIKSNDVIVTGSTAAEPKMFLENLHTIADRVENVTITNCLPMAQCEYFTNPEYLKSFKVTGWFYTPVLRKMHSTGRASFIPNHLHLAATKRIQCQKPTVFMCCAAMPDEDGKISLGLSNIYEMQCLEAADLVILEINPNCPRLFGDHVVTLDQVDYLIETDYILPEIADAPSSDKDKVIGKFIADLVNDGDCIQIGIGGIPNAVCAYLADKKDLGVHTEMMTTGIMRLMKAGAVNNSKKQTHNGKTVACFAGGTHELYEFCNNNPDVLILNGKECNDPYVIGQNDNQVSINTTIEIDLTGQCCSESIGHVQFSGTGGQADTAVGAQNSKNGRSFIALYSTAMVKNKETGEKEEISKIVPMLKPGAIVSLSRNDVDFVVTEYGVAALRGTTVEERCQKLIEIAHPKFRDELRKQAIEYGYMPG